MIGEVVGRQVRTQNFDGSAGLAGSLRHVGHVDGHEIHGDAADDGHIVSGDMHMRAVDEVTEIAVRIPQRNRGNPALPGRPPGAAIAHGLESIDAARLQDARLQGNHAQHRIGPAGQGIDAVERRAGAQQVEVIVRAEEDAGGVRERGRCTRHGPHERSKARKLLAVDRVPRLLGGDEMADDQRQPKPAQAAALVDQDLRILCAEAQPVHAGVDMNDGVEWPLVTLGRRTPGIELAEMVEHRRQSVLDEIGFCPGEQAVQDVDRMLRQHAAQRNALVDMGDEELPAAFGGQAWPHNGSATAIGIGLEHAGTVDRPALSTPSIAQAAPVGGNRAHVDGEDRTSSARVLVVGGKGHSGRS